MPCASVVGTMFDGCLQSNFIRKFHTMSRNVSMLKVLLKFMVEVEVEFCGGLAQ